MRFFNLATAALLVPAAIAAVAEIRPRRPFGCGTHEPTEEELLNTQQIAAQEALEGPAVSARQVTNVDVYFHVVASSDSLSGGYLTVSFSLLILYSRLLLTWV